MLQTAILLFMNLANKLLNVSILTTGICINYYFNLGSAHTVAGPYWAAILKETTLRARQCSPRGGDLTVTVRDSTVVVEGGAFIVMKGRLNIS